MTLSNITDRGTLRGVIYRGAGSGTTDYTELSNKPQINGNVLSGNKTGNELGLANLSDIPSVPDISINNNEAYYTPLKNIKLNGNGYNVYSEVFKGAKQTPTPENGKVGLVPMPIAAYNDNEKFLKGDGNWERIDKYSETTLFEQAYNANFPVTITLSESFENFDAIGFYLSKSDDSGYYDFLPAQIFSKSTLNAVLNGAIAGRTNTILVSGWQHTNNSQYARFQIDNTTQLTTKVSGGLWSLYKITGIKFG